ncbi:hypothetical protein MNBD_GAMMA12-2234, partial [hydrothermal vent metagenome]
MKKKMYEEFIEGNNITDCFVMSKNHITFALKEFQHAEDDRRPPEDRSTSVLLYAPKEYADSGGFGGESWESGIEQIFVSYQSVDEGIIYCDTDFNAYEVKCETIDFAKVDRDKGRDDFTRGAEGITYIDNEVYIVGFFRKVFKRTGV